jgi:transcriptional antiterminator NusG
MEMVEGWYALQLRAKWESKVALALVAKGYDVLYPTYRSAVTRGRTSVMLERPLFPSYVFCHLRDGASGKIVTTPGVIRIVGSGRWPTPIPDSEISAIHKSIAADLPRFPCKFIPTGSRVRIENGPLAGAEGALVGESNSRNLIISINLLQRSVAVRVGVETAITAVGTYPFRESKAG